MYAPLDQAIGGGAYGDSEVRDDFYWAACELYATTGDSKYWADINEFEIPAKVITVTSEADGSTTEVNVAGQEKFKLTTDLGGGENKGSFTSFNWGCTAGLGTLTLYLALSEGGTQAGKQDAALAIIEESIKETADTFILEQTFDPTASRTGDVSEHGQGYGIPYNGAAFTDDINAPGQVFDGYEWGSNSFVINNSIVMAYAYQISNDVKYMNGVITSMDYLLGRNAMDFSFVSGYGEYHLVYPHHRYWSHENDSNYPYAPAGVLSGGPNLGMQDPYIKGAGFDPTGTPSQFCYIDSAESWSTNEITINWNSPLVWITKYLNDNAADAGDGTEPPKGGEGEGEATLGDVNLDGDVAKMDDVVLFGKYLNNKIQLSAKALANADCTQDGSTNTEDLSAIVSYLLGTIKSF
ncbi:MAG: glycoside hydrolase family 9 protein [Oscillospiraceae bacterium]|nr:glycoside hydrolase family 9 protein [Oscillospiraceae bacterium]